VSACPAPLRDADHSVLVPSMLAVMGLVDPTGSWGRSILSRLGMRHAVLAAYLEGGTLVELLLLIQRLPSLVQLCVERGLQSSGRGGGGVLGGEAGRLLEGNTANTNKKKF